MWVREPPPLSDAVHRSRAWLQKRDGSCLPSSDPECSNPYSLVSVRSDESSFVTGIDCSDDTSEHDQDGIDDHYLHQYGKYPGHLGYELYGLYESTTSLLVCVCSSV